MTENKCGECNMCCKVLGIPELKKMPTKWCTHCDIGKGCTIYESRPQSCVEFKCGWLINQEMGNGKHWSPELRPDKSKVVICPTTNPNVVSVITDIGSKHNWEKGEIYERIKAIVDSGVKVCVGWDDGPDKILLYKMGPRVVGKRSIKMSKPDENGMQWFDINEGNTIGVQKINGRTD